MGDHDVPLLGNGLRGKNIALLVCGGIAAIKAPTLARALRRFGADVTAFISSEGLNYTTLTAMEWATTNKVISKLTSDSEHLHKDRPFDAYLVAPATYNTINKFAGGIADTPITTTLAAALGLLEKKRAKIIVVPTMHGDMHNTVLTENVNKLHSKGVTFMPPRDAYGKHNLPESMDIAHFVCRELSDSPLKGVPILITAGPTPVEVDQVRIITNVFKGTLGVALAQHFWLKGAKVHLVLGRGLVPSNPQIPTTVIHNFDDYRKTVLGLIGAEKFQYGLFSAAVADYRPAQVFAGKIPSGDASKQLDLVPTTKVIDEVLEQFPSLRMISFKLEVGATADDFRRLAKERLGKGHFAVVANELSETNGSHHTAYLYCHKGEEKTLRGRGEIASALSELVENDLKTLS